MSRPSPLSREKIAAAALAIADAEGFSSVSMRRIAQEMGVGTMSLYYYVKTKADLIAVMDDALMGEVLALSLPANWREALTVIATRTRDVFLAAPVGALLHVVGFPRRQRDAPHGTMPASACWDNHDHERKTCVACNNR
jgi:AcrR family transcriptional regulator